jgi:hypothetical protein
MMRPDWRGGFTLRRTRNRTLQLGVLQLALAQTNAARPVDGVQAARRGKSF